MGCIALMRQCCRVKADIQSSKLSHQEFHCSHVQRCFERLSFLILVLPQSHHIEHSDIWSGPAIFQPFLLIKPRTLDLGRGGSIAEEDFGANQGATSGRVEVVLLLSHSILGTILKANNLVVHKSALLATSRSVNTQSLSNLES